MNIDVVGVFNADFRQVLAGLNIIKATMDQTAKVFEHPIETGSTINDHKIINPTEIELTCILSGSQYRNVYQEVNQLFRSEQLLTVQTRTGSYPNMTISKMPHEESGDIAQGIFITISFKEAFLFKAQFGVLSLSDVRDPSQSSTVNRGEQLSSTPSAQTQEQGSFLYRQFFQ